MKMTNKERMSQIGEVMDELVKLGFEFDVIKGFKRTGNNINKIYQPKKFLFIKFEGDYAWIDKCLPLRFEYNSPTWQEDLINKVKELINE